tara:strand:+ start:148 stop:372 length:225 start_codon:yes stop_codon:yes gene_type:complete
MRSEALKEAQKRYREKNRTKINEYYKEYEKSNYTKEKSERKKLYYLQNKERIAQRYFETSVFTGFRKIMKEDYR